VLFVNDLMYAFVERVALLWHYQVYTQWTCEPDVIVEQLGSSISVGFSQAWMSEGALEYMGIGNRKLPPGVEFLRELGAPESFLDELLMYVKLPR